MPCISHYSPFLLNHSSHHVCYFVPPPNLPVLSFTICTLQLSVMCRDNWQHYMWQWVLSCCFGGRRCAPTPPTRLFYSQTKLADPWNRLWSCQVTFCTADMPSCVSHYSPFLLNHSSHHVCYLVPPMSVTWSLPESSRVFPHYTDTATHSHLSWQLSITCDKGSFHACFV